jgi:hypothetical protein
MLTNLRAGWQLRHSEVSAPAKICEKFKPILILEKILTPFSAVSPLDEK